MSRDRFVVRFSNAVLVGSGTFAACNIVLWLFYWLTQPESTLCEIIAILLFALLPIFVFLHYISWKVCVLNNRIILYSFFRKKEYQFSQICNVIGYSSWAERGGVIWLYFQNGDRVKIAHSMKNYKKLHYYLTRRRTIEWK